MTRISEMVANGTPSLDDFDSYFNSKSSLFRNKFEKIYHLVPTEDATMLTTTFIDSMKSLEKEIHFSELSVEKNELFALTSVLKYGIQYTVCASSQREGTVMGKKTFNQFQATNCCCGKSCYCCNAIKDFAMSGITFAVAGGVGGGAFGPGIAAGAILGFTVGIWSYEFNR